MALLRWIASPPAAALITAGLFAMMALLIRNPGLDLPAPKPLVKTDITFKPDPLKLDPKPARPVLPDQPPLRIAPQDSTGLPDPVPPPPQRTPQMEGDPRAALRIDPPLIRRAPPYPQSCASKGVEGIVMVQFDVTPSGDVINPRLLQTPHRCFQRSVLAALGKWKYPPSRTGARRRGLVETFNFQLVD